MSLPRAIARDRITDAAKERKPGYEQAVLQAAERVTDTHVYLSSKNFHRIRREYATTATLASPPDLTRADAPSFLTKVKNFAVSAANHVVAGMPMASDAEILRRHDICMACEFFKDNACQKCGCPIVRARQYVSKLSWADSECPAGKWGKEATGAGSA